MTQYFTDFSETQSPVDMTMDLSGLGINFNYDEYSYGFPLLNISDAWDDVGAWRVGVSIGGVITIRKSWSLAGRKALIWYKPGVFADVVSTCQFYVNPNVTARPSILLRGSGERVKETGYIFMLRMATGVAEISKYVNGTFTAIGTVSFSISRETWYNLKAECVGTTLRMKCWPVGSAEPGTWTLSATDSSIARGYCGLFEYEGESTYYSRSFFTALRVIGTPVSPGDWFHGWTRPVGNCIPYIEAELGAAGGKVLKMFNPTGTSARKAFFWEDVVASNEVEVVVRVKVSSVSLGVHLLRLQSNGDVSESGYFIRLAGTGGGIELWQYIDGVSTSLDTTTLSESVFPISANTYFWVRMYHNRSTRSLKVKAWADGSSEPGAYQIDVTAPTGYDAIGFVGVGSFQSAGDTQTYDIFGVGTNGDAAPVVGA